MTMGGDGCRIIFPCTPVTEVPETIGYGGGAGLGSIGKQDSSSGWIHKVIGSEICDGTGFRSTQGQQVNIGIVSTIMGCTTIFPHDAVTIYCRHIFSPGDPGVSQRSEPSERS